MANIFGKISTTCYQNQPGFVDDVTKTFGVFLGSQFRVLFTYKTRQLSFIRQCSDIIQVSLNYCASNLFRTVCTKFYQYRLGFVKDMTKTFWCVFVGSQCRLRTTENCLVLSPIQFTPPTRTRQDSLVLCVSAV